MSDRLHDLQIKRFDEIEHFIKSNEIDKAIEVAIASYFLSKGRGLDAEQLSVGQIYIAFGALFQKDTRHSNQACSFCGRSGKDVWLGAGPDAFICDNCVKHFSERINQVVDKNLEQND